MPSTMEQVPNDVHFSLFKGEPGTRKSTAAVSYPKPQYWFSFDGKMNALTIPIQRWNINPKDIHFDDYTDWDSARQKLESFLFGTQLTPPVIPYKTIIIDSITSCADYMLRQVRKQKIGQTRQSGQKSGKFIGGIEVGEIEDYNAEASGLTELIALTKQIHKLHKIDIILIAHVIRKETKSLDGRTNVTRTIVTAGKGPAAKIPALCDEAYHFGIEPSVVEGQAGDYIIQTENAGDDYARTTLRLPTIIKIGGDNLYEQYIKPAITKQKSQTVSTTL